MRRALTAQLFYHWQQGNKALTPSLAALTPSCMVLWE